MPPPLDISCFHLLTLPESFYVVKILPGAPIPGYFVNLLVDASAHSGALISITRTKEEISIVGESHPGMPDFCKNSLSWRCVKIAGPMEFELTGVLANFTAPLKNAKVPVFAVSTWNTDYVLVPDEKLEEAVRALEQDGWTFRK